MLDVLHGAKYFSTMDLLSGYHQLAMHRDSCQKTAFATQAGLFEFNAMPFGLSNAPCTFQRLMECVLRGLNWDTCLIYLDDIIVFSNTFEEHLKRLRLVLNRLREANVKLKPKKCHFGRPRQVQFLGHVVSQHGVEADPEKIQAVAEFSRTQSLKDFRSFLGLANYYRRFIKDFARLAAPLTRLTRKDVKFQWYHSCATAFDQLKRALTNAPILAYPDLYVDASRDGLWMVLGQTQYGNGVVIAYSGRELNRVELETTVRQSGRHLQLFRASRSSKYTCTATISSCIQITTSSYGL